MKKILLAIALLLPITSFSSSQQNPYRNYALVGGIVGLIGTGVSAWSYAQCADKFKAIYLLKQKFDSDLRNAHIKIRKANSLKTDFELSLENIRNIKHDNEHLDHPKPKRTERVAQIRQTAQSLAMDENTMNSLDLIEDHDGHCKEKCEAYPLLGQDKNRARIPCQSLADQLNLIKESFNSKKQKVETDVIQAGQQYDELDLNNPSPSPIFFRKLKKQKDLAFQKMAGFSLLTTILWSWYAWTGRK
jgi:hypothetical protein